MTNQSFETTSKDQLIHDFRVLGIHEGDLLWVHSSLKSLGKVQRGADTVINALLEALGPRGDLVMPAFYESFVSMESQKDKPGFHPDLSPSETGRITEVFRKRPGVLHSLHPTHRTAAYGPNNELFTKNHARTSPFNREGPFGKLFERDCKILFLGCGLGPNSFLHAYEDWLDMPYLSTEEVRIRNSEGETSTVLIPKEPMGDRDFYYNGGRSGKEMLEKGVIRRGQVGIAEVFITTAKTQGEYVTKRLREDGEWLLCKK